MHKETEKQIEIHRCIHKCTFTGKTKKEILKHYNTEHRKILYCRICPERAKTQDEIREHMKKNHKWSMLKCNQCKKKEFINKADLKRHNKSEHKIEETGDGSDTHIEQTKKNKQKKEKDKGKTKNKRTVNTGTKTSGQPPREKMKGTKEGKQRRRTTGGNLIQTTKIGKNETDATKTGNT